MKLEKIEREMQKTREKIADLQSRLKELDGQKTEQENLQIIQLVRSMRLSPDELKIYLQGERQTAAPVAATTGSTYEYTTQQEDNEDEE